MDNLSRSELKRQHKQVEAAAVEILQLSDDELRRMDLGEELIESVQLCRGLKGGALKRQTKYVAKLLKQQPLQDIFSHLAQLKGSKLEQNRYHHEAERLRDAIINEALQARQESLQSGEPFEMDWASETLQHVVDQFEDLDEKDLRTAAHQYARRRNKVHHRELFRMIRAAAEKKRRFAP